MKKFEFHSRFPPEELKERLEREIAVENAILDGHGKMKARWKGLKLRLNRWDGGVRRGVQTSKTPNGFYLSKGVIAEAYVPNPFRGKIFPDGAGGSVLRGGIVLHWASLCLIAAFAALTFLSIWLDNEHPFSWVRVLAWEALIVGFGGGMVIRDYIRVLPGSRAMLEFLERTFTKLEDE